MFHGPERLPVAAGYSKVSPGFVAKLRLVRRSVFRFDPPPRKSLCLGFGTCGSEAIETRLHIVRLIYSFLSNFVAFAAASDVGVAAGVRLSCAMGVFSL